MYSSTREKAHGGKKGGKNIVPCASEENTGGKGKGMMAPLRGGKKEP